MYIEAVYFTDSFLNIQTTLEEYLNTVDCGITEFYNLVRAAQHEPNDPYVTMFIDCLLASADYESFYKVMAREGSKSAAKRAVRNIAADAKAESKSPGKSPKARSENSKWGEDDDEGDKKSYK